MRFENLVFWRYHFGFMPDGVIEMWLWGIAALLAFVLSRAQRKRFHSPSALVRIADHPLQSILVSALLPLAVRGILCIWTGIPVPRVQDEWSQLFGAKTFAMGRLTNPTPRLWQHFETFHINMVPSYQSMYLPGHALVLALGHLLFRNYWFGCWIEVALLAGATCWALQAVVPGRWALLGGIFCAVRFGTFSYWMNAYHGGALIAAGGALLIGAYLHSRVQLSTRNACIGAAGLVMLGFTRPYEGALFAAPIVCWWAVKALRSRHRVQHLRALAPAVAVVLLAMAWLGYYNHRGTGSALRFAYVVNQQQYHITNAFWMQSLPAYPEFRHAGMQKWAESQEREQYQLAGSWRGRAQLLEQKVTTAYIFYFFPASFLLLLGGWLAWRDAELRIIVIACFVMLAGIALELWVPQSHYFAPMTAALMIFLMLGLRRLASTHYGHALALVALVLCFGNVALEARTYVRFIRSDEVQHGWNRQRVRMEQWLDSQPGRQLVIVRYSPTVHIWHREWVYNQPDLDRASVIWARDMGDAANGELARAYPDRSVWLLEPDHPVPALKRLSTSTTAESLSAWK